MGAGLVPIPLPSGGIGAGLVPIPIVLNGGMGAGLVPIPIDKGGIGAGLVPMPAALRRTVTLVNTTNNASSNASLKFFTTFLPE
jgi:Na+/citrate or Na+/malate symporter